MKGFRLLFLTTLVAVLTGCTTTTRVVSTSDPVAVRSADEALSGRRAEIALATGEETFGRILFIRIDSTAWQEDRLQRAAPTPSVTLIRHRNLGRSIRNGALIGAGVGVALSVDVLLTPGPEDTDEIGNVIENGLFEGFRGFAAVALPLVGAGVGVFGGAVAGRRTEYVFVNAPPAGTPAVVEPPAVPETSNAAEAPAATEVPAGGGE